MQVTRYASDQSLLRVVYKDVNGHKLYNIVIKLYLMNLEQENL